MKTFKPSDPRTCLDLYTDQFFFFKEQGNKSVAFGCRTRAYLLYDLLREKAKLPSLDFKALITQDSLDVPLLRPDSIALFVLRHSCFL